MLAGLQARGIPARAAVLADHDDLPDAHETVELDLLDPTTFSSAVAGTRALFLMRPPPIARVGPTVNALVDAAITAGVGHVVFVSVAGADTNRIVPHHRVETHLQASAIDHTILRPGFFAQNLGDAYRADIRDNDRLYLPAGDGRVAFIDVRDLGEAAAGIFAEPGPHVGAAYHLTGPVAVTLDQVAEDLTTALGRTIRYEAAPVPGYLAHLRRRGMPIAQVAVQTVLHVGLRRGDAEPVTFDLVDLLGREPRTINDYVNDHTEYWSTS